jgi:hypothetical protein
MITKQREDPGGGSNSWNVYHHKNTSAPETDYLVLEGTGATSDSNIRWNDTAPTSSVFTVGTGNSVNQSGVDHIMYLWSEKQGFSKMGSYEGNNNSDGTFVYTGFASPGTSPVTGCTMDFLSNGFKWRDNAANCNNANTFIYMAWAEAPFVNSKGVPCNAT